MTDPDLQVALDVTPLAGTRTGVGQFVAELHATLARRRDEVGVLPYVLSRRVSLEEGGLPPGTVRLSAPAGLALRLWAQVGWPAFDGPLGAASVVHGTNFSAPPSRKRAVVVTVHDLACLHHPHRCTSTARRITAVARRVARQGGWIHTPSEYVANDVRRHFETDRVRSIPHGVPHLPRSESSPRWVDELVRQGPYVLGLGALIPRKQPHLLVEAFGLAAPRHPDLRLVVAGPDGEALADVERALSALSPPVRARVHLLGPVSDEERSGLLRGAAILAYPSLDEGFGLPVLEAMSVGVPVVASNAGALPEIAGSAARLVETRSPEALAGAMEEILSDESRRAHLIEAGRARAGRFSWEETADRMTTLYRTAAEELG